MDLIVSVPLIAVSVVLGLGVAASLGTTAQVLLTQLMIDRRNKAIRR